jgi:hypothetical protein
VSAKPSTSLLSQQRSIITAARPALVSRQQWLVPSFQKRFSSDEVKKNEEATESEEVVATESSGTPAEVESAVETSAKTAPTESSNASYGMHNPKIVAHQFIGR